MVTPTQGMKNRELDIVAEHETIWFTKKGHFPRVILISISPKGESYSLFSQKMASPRGYFVKSAGGLGVFARGYFLRHNTPLPRPVNDWC